MRSITFCTTASIGKRSIKVTVIGAQQWALLKACVTVNVTETMLVLGKPDGILDMRAVSDGSGAVRAASD